MHARKTADSLACISCGYDLRATGAGDGKCPECGFAVRDSVAARARTGELWAWKVRLGITLLIVPIPLLVWSLLTYSQWYGVGLPVTTLNFFGPKAWGMPLIRMYRGSQSEFDTAAAVIGTLINTFGIFLLTAPAAGRHEAALSLRRWLRVCAVAAAPVLWAAMTPWYGWFRLPAEDRYHMIASLLLIELPGTAMLYLYLAQLARDRVRDPRLARRAVLLLKAALVLQIPAAVAVSHAFVLVGPIALAAFSLYAAFAIGAALWALDLLLDLYRAFTEIEREEARR